MQAKLVKAKSLPLCLGNVRMFVLGIHVNKSPAAILLFQWRKWLGMYFSILALLNYMQYYALSNHLMYLGYFYSQWRKALASKVDLTNSDTRKGDWFSSFNCSMYLGSSDVSVPPFDMALWCCPNAVQIWTELKSLASYSLFMPDITFGYIAVRNC